MPKIDMRMRSLEDRELLNLVDRIATERARKERKPAPKSYSSVPTSTVVPIAGEQSNGSPATITKVKFSGTPTYYSDGAGGMYQLRSVKSAIGTQAIGKEAFAAEDFGSSMDTVVLNPTATSQGESS